MDVSSIDWKSIGSKLERLILADGVTFSEDGLKRMRKHCHNLKRIELRGSNPVEENGRIPQFISLYGDQFDFAYVGGMTEPELNLVVGACTNAANPAHIDGRDLLLPTLRILGPRLEKVYVNDGALIDADEWVAAWSLCSNLKALELSEMRSDEICAIMSTPKQNLKDLRIWHTEVDEIMNKIVEATGNVEFFEFVGGITRLNMFHKFIDKNKSTLRSVYFNIEKSITKAELDEMMKQPIVCPRPRNFLRRRSSF